MPSYRGWAEKQRINGDIVLGNWLTLIFALALGKVSPTSISSPGQQERVICHH